MNEALDLKKLEKKMWTAHFQDGFLDIFFAFMFIIQGIQSVYYNSWFTLLMFVNIFIFIMGKQYIVKPRLGNVKFGTKRLEKQQRARLVLLATFLFTLIIFILSASGQPKPRVNFSIVIIIMFIAIFGSLAYFMDFPRFLLYGALFAVGEYTISTMGETVHAWIMFGSGGFLMMVGFYYLFLFVKSYPLSGKEATNG